MRGQFLKRLFTSGIFKKLGWGVMWAAGAASAAYLTGFLKGCGL